MKTTNRKSRLPQLGFSLSGLLAILILATILIFGIAKLGNIKKGDMGGQNGEAVSENPLWPRAGVSLSPGPEWQMLSNGPLTEFPQICSPVLEGIGKNTGCLIQVFSSDSTATVKSFAYFLKGELPENKAVLKNSFKELQFKSSNDVHGYQITYDYETGEGSSTEIMRVHAFLFRNKNHRCAAVVYICAVKNESVEPSEMILKTLVTN